MFEFKFSKQSRILIIGALLLIFGIAAVYSVSIHESFSLTLRQYGEPTNSFYFIRHIRNIAISIVLALIVYKTPITWWKKYSFWIFLAFFVFQLLVFTPLSKELNGARGWILLPGFGTIQPAEFFKLGFVVLLSSWLVKKRQMLTTIQGFVGFLLVSGLCYFVFLLIPDLGTVMVLGLLSLLMYWYGGGRKRFVLASVLVGVVVATVVVTQVSYINKRFAYFFSPDSDKSGRGAGWQTKQAMIAIGGGGVFGQGYGKGLQKFGYIPEAQSDFVFAAFGEEVGFVGGTGLLALFFILMLVFVTQLQRVNDPFYKLLGGGLIGWIIIQAFINIGVNTNLLPLTGLTLPFISTGGSSLMVNCVALILLFKIARIGQNPSLAS